MTENLELEIKEIAKRVELAEVILDNKINNVEAKTTMLEKQVAILVLDLHKVITQLSAVRWILLGIIIAESPQTVQAILSLIGF